MKSTSTPSSALGSCWSWGSDTNVSENDALLAAKKELNRVFVQGDIHVDFSGLKLKNLPEEFKDLQYYTTIHQTKLTGCEHLRLSGNRLPCVPPDVFLLRHLTVLSLRNNLLREIPAEIQCLRNLRELSIGGNRLKYLPAELLRLDQLDSLLALPNPLLSDNRIYPLSETQPYKLMELCARVLLQEAYQARRCKEHGSKPSSFQKWKTATTDALVTKRPENPIQDNFHISSSFPVNSSTSSSSPTLGSQVSRGLQRWKTDLTKVMTPMITSPDYFLEDNAVIPSNDLLDISNPIFDDEQQAMSIEAFAMNKRPFTSVGPDTATVKRSNSRLFMEQNLLQHIVAPPQTLLRSEDIATWLHHQPDNPVVGHRKSSFTKAWSFSHASPVNSSPLLVPEQVVDYVAEHALSGGQCFSCKTPVVKSYLIDILFYDCCKNVRLPFIVKLCSRNCYQTAVYQNLRRKYNQ